MSTRSKQVTFFATGHKQNQDHPLLDFPARCVRFRCVLGDLFTAVVCVPCNTFSLLDVMTFVCTAESEVNQDSQTVCHQFHAGADSAGRLTISTTEQDCSSEVDSVDVDFSGSRAR